MPTFEPFAGIRYGAADLSALIAPPYDVISEEHRARLEAADPHNAVRLELPQPEDGVDRYEAAARRLRRWLAAGGPLRGEDLPTFTVYRMSFGDGQGTPHATTGVIGALTLEPPGEGDILPHERTTPKAKSDRLDLIRATGANLSPVWGLSLAAGLSALIRPAGPPLASGTDEHGVVHEAWPLRDPVAVDAVRAAVASAPVVIADGHHRYEVALAYQAEQRAAQDASAGAGGARPWDAVMTYVVELSEEQLTVAAIHRLITGLPADFDVVDALGEWFEPVGTASLDVAIGARLVEAGALGLVRSGEPAVTLLRPRAKTIEAAEHDLDSSRLDVALAGWPAHQLAYEHDVGAISTAVASSPGATAAGVLLRPATVAQIAEVARARDRMPPKTTFFTPKPATGIVFRPAR